MSFKVLGLLSALTIATVFISSSLSQETSKPQERKETKGEELKIGQDEKAPPKNTTQETKRKISPSKTPRQTIREALKEGVDAYPLQSMEGRIPNHTKPSDPTAVGLSSAVQKDLAEMESEPVSRRSSLLRSMHLMAERVFADTQGRGIERMAAVSKEAIDNSNRSDEVPVQPERLGTPLAEQSPPPSAQKIEDALKTLHRAGIADFASQQDFGYLTKDGKKAAGFISHRFTKTPPVDPRLEMKRIDLVGLLMHPKPVVYLSEKLPRMEELKSAPTRTPDEFETKAIEKLRKGETIVLSDDQKGVRMVGAIRAAKQCTACHECQRGELLGAFSYRFERP